MWADRLAASAGRLKDRVVDWFKRMWSEAKASFKRTTGEIAADVTRWVTKLVTFVTDLKNRFVSWVKRMWSEAENLLRPKPCCDRRGREPLEGQADRLRHRSENSVRVLGEAHVV